MTNWQTDAKKLAQDLSFAAKCIRYYLRRSKLHDCNDCGKYKCQYAPKPGEDVRINCPLWEESKE